MTSATQAAISAAAARLHEVVGPFPWPRPLLPRSPYVNYLGWITDVAANIRWEAEQRAGLHQAPAVPCGSPRQRGGSHFTPTCVCGHAMGRHKNPKRKSA